MAKMYAIVVGIVLLLVGILGFIFSEGFGSIPTYLLVVNVLAGVWGLLVGFWGESNAGRLPPRF